MPLPLKLPISVKDTLAVGAELNNVICAAKKEDCFLSQYIGDTSKLETATFLKEATRKLIRLTRLKPGLIACDLHPGYSSTAFAEELSERNKSRLFRIQHHKAHVASVAAEHGITDYLGIAMDGLGYGEDGKIWGGEVFDVAGGRKFKRIGSLEEQPQLGGDSAAIYPKKMLFGALSGFLAEKELQKLGLFGRKESALYLKQIEKGFNVPLTTSSGRILDSVSALLGFCDHRTYDGRPAMVLESKATTPYRLEPVIIRKDGRKILSTSSLFSFMIENKHRDKRRLAATAQTYLAEGLLQIAQENAKGRPVVLSGGVAYNRMIAGFMAKQGILVNKDIPCGDGGICYGQAYLANLTSAYER